MKAQRIECEIHKETMEKILPLIKKATTFKGDGSFFLQVSTDGTARGLYLPKKDGLKVQAVLKPIWETAKDFKRG